MLGVAVLSMEPERGDDRLGESLDETVTRMQRLSDAASNSAASLEELLSCARPRLMRLVQVRMPAQMASRLDAEDIVQETLVSAAKRFEDYQRDAKVPVYVWLRGLAIERLIDAERRHLGAAKRAVSRELAQQQWLSQSSVDVLHRWAADTKSPSQVVSDRQRSQDLKNALEQLPEKYREILIVRFFESMTLAEAAAALGVTVANAKVMQFRGLQLLESVIQETIGWQSADRTL